MNIHKLFNLAMAFIFISSLVGMPTQTVLAASDPLCYVYNTSTGTNDGSTWSDAFPELQSALADTNCTEIWVAAGMYVPTSDGDRTVSFVLKNGVSIYGGFAGGETQLEERDPVRNKTILSGDLNKDDDSFNNNGENSYHVVKGVSGTDSSAVLDGFIISSGNANDASYPNNDGGGLYNNGGSPTLTNLTFSGNSAYWDGGGMLNDGGGSPTLTNVTFSGNSAIFGGGLGNYGSPTLVNVTFTGNMAAYSGGGMVSGDGNPMLTDVTFSGNTALGAAGGMYTRWGSTPTLRNVTFSGNSADVGGGMFNDDSSNAVLENVVFNGNTANSGGGMYNDLGSSPSLTDVTFSGNMAAANGGGMVNISSSSPTLANVTFSNNNAAEDGGGLYNSVSSDPTLIGVTFEHNAADHNGGGMFNDASSPALTNVTFTGNSATNNGGGIYNDCSNPTLTNVTMSGNTATYGGGIYDYASSPVIKNTILWGDGIEISGSSPMISDSIVQGGCPYGSPQGYCMNIITDNPILGPLQDNGGFTQTMALQRGSSAVEAGDSANCPATDQRGVTRPQQARCDIGAYELVIQSNAQPVADAGGPYTAAAGQTITLDASISSDPDGDALFYGWDLDNDGEYDDATAVTTTTVFNQAGEYVVGLRVMDSLGLEDIDTATVIVSQYASNARVSIQPPNQVRGYGWTLGENVTLTIDDPLNGPGVDYSAVKTVIVADWDPNQTMVDFNMPSGFEIKPGFVVTLTDGAITKTTTTVLLTLEDIDVNADTVSGTADPAAIVTVWTEDAMRTVTTGQDGKWIADFSIPGGAPWEQNMFDILPGMFFMAWISDENGNDTTVWGDTPSPVFMLNIGNDSVWWGLDAWNWPLGSQVTLTVDDPNTPGDTDYTEVQTMHQGNDEYHFSHAQYDAQGGGFTGYPGFTITLSDGIQTKSMIIPVLQVTGYDLEADTISGITDPFASVVVACDVNAQSTVNADSNGNWMASFRDPENPLTVLYDVQPGTVCEPQMYDDDRDHIVLRDWSVPMDTTPPTITWLGNIHDGDSFYFGFVPPEPTCTASDDLSGVDKACIVTGYASMVGMHTLTATARDNAGNIATETRSYTVLPWTLNGFYQPVDMSGVYNVVKGGSTVPIKFEIFAGNELTDTAYVKSLTPTPTSCSLNAPVDEIEIVTIGVTSLRYDAQAGQFIYNWKSPKAPGQCYRATMTTTDGSSLVAYFKLK